MFHVGQKVVCVDDDFFSTEMCEPLHLPIKDHVYTIRDVVSNDRFSWYRLVEIVNAPSPTDLKGFGKVEPAFMPSHFRPVLETSKRASAKRKVDA